MSNSYFLDYCGVKEVGKSERIKNNYTESNIQRKGKFLKAPSDANT